MGVQECGTANKRYAFQTGIDSQSKGKPLSLRVKRRCFSANSFFNPSLKELPGLMML